MRSAKYLAFTPYGIAELEQLTSDYIGTKWWDRPLNPVEEMICRVWLQDEGWFDLVAGRAGMQIARFGVDHDDIQEVNNLISSLGKEIP